LPDERDTVYVIDPDEAIRDGLTTFLGTLDIPVRSYSNAEAFLDSHPARSLSQGCLLVDANLQGMGSLALLRQLRAQRVDLPVVVLASTSNRHIADQVFEAGAVDVIEKPQLDSVLVDRLRQLLIRAPGLAAAAPRSFILRNGTEVSIRAIQPGDAEIEQAFVRGLSARSRYLRFFSTIKELSPYMLEQFTHPRYPCNWALIATISDAERETEIGVVRYAASEVDSCAEFAIVVADEWQGLGIATQLLRELITVAERAGIERLEGLVLRENRAMLELANELGFTTERYPDDATVVRVIRNLAVSDYQRLPVTTIAMANDRLTQ
jgi:FixJ family two-component response regulator